MFLAVRHSRLPVMRPVPSPAHFGAGEKSMRKIRLSLENLAVDSFNTAADGEKDAGTVHGHAATEPLVCNFSRGTCFQSCAMTNGYQYCILPYC